MDTTHTHTHTHTRQARRDHTTTAGRVEFFVNQQYRMYEAPPLLTYTLI